MTPEQLKRANELQEQIADLKDRSNRIKTREEYVSISYLSLDTKVIVRNEDGYTTSLNNNINPSYFNCSQSFKDKITNELLDTLSTIKGLLQSEITKLQKEFDNL